ncbi:UDP-glucose 4-epimerase GalE [Candidatus Saccharibacteria bacterium]|nr:MAG: UDP-glucose 4-epimerase GalE [Candidatus Saccharibacteria bacterium]
MRILVTGGAGYIGSHTVVELLEADNEVVVVDNLSNSSEESLRRVEEITGRNVIFRELDVRYATELTAVFDEFEFDAVMHFAGLKAVGESVEKPLAYYRNNIDSTLTLMEVMRKNDVRKLIFSSSATVYGNPSELPLTETSPTGQGITNPYGQTKYMIEQILRDIATAAPELELTLLRYFNPIGAHSSGRIGEDPKEIPNNLMPYISQVAVGNLDRVRIFGNDYDTPDGTGVRDYIHVVDLAKGHLAALAKSKPGTNVYNLGTGTGVSVLELLRAFSNAVGKDIPYEIIARRPGDVATCFASAAKAARDLNWRAEKTLEQACADSWRWQSQNPAGYAT